MMDLKHKEALIVRGAFGMGFALARACLEAGANVLIAGRSEAKPARARADLNAPGLRTGAHPHPMSLVGVVTRGSFRFQQEGDAMRVLKTGTALFELAGRRILHFDNVSRRRKAEIVAFYLTDDDTRPWIEKLD